MESLKLLKVVLAVLAVLISSCSEKTFQTQSNSKESALAVFNNIKTIRVCNEKEQVVRSTLETPFLAEVKKNFPEGKKMNNALINSAVNPNLYLRKEAEISVTFVDEGAGYKNTFGYFIYNDKNNDGLISSDEIIDTCIIFRNASKVGSGGPLKEGDTVNLGTFEAGSKVGFFIIADGANAPHAKGSFFTIDSLNADYFRHVAVLLTSDKKNIVIGIEDMLKLGDADYNDILFTVKTVPASAVEDIAEDSNIPYVDNTGTVVPQPTTTETGTDSATTETGTTTIPDTETTETNSGTTTNTETNTTTTTDTGSTSTSETNTGSSSESTTTTSDPNTNPTTTPGSNDENTTPTTTPDPTPTVTPDPTPVVTPSPAPVVTPAPAPIALSVLSSNFSYNESTATVTFNLSLSKTAHTEITVYKNSASLLNSVYDAKDLSLAIASATGGDFYQVTVRSTSSSGEVVENVYFHFIPFADNSDTGTGDFEGSF